MLLSCNRRDPSSIRSYRLDFTAQVLLLLIQLLWLSRVRMILLLGMIIVVVKKSLWRLLGRNLSPWSLGIVHTYILRGIILEEILLVGVLHIYASLDLTGVVRT